MLLSAMAPGHTKIRGTEAKGPFSSFLVKKDELPKAGVG